MLNGKGAGLRPATKIQFSSSLSQSQEVSTSRTFPTFVTGVPEGRVDSYTHIAGRTGRFGKTGDIITFAKMIEVEIDEGRVGGRRIS